jgi:hypothetical protein
MVGLLVLKSLRVSVWEERAIARLDMWITDQDPGGLVIEPLAV